MSLPSATPLHATTPSIVEDIQESRLNIDILQKNQAEKELKSADEVLPRIARECFSWLLCPVQHTATQPQIDIEPFKLNTSSGAIGSEIERVCLDHELVIQTWSPIHLRETLKELYWKDGKTAVRAIDFWEDTLRYLYLPRLAQREVFANTIRNGANSRDFFGTAYGQSGDRFDGFQFGSGNVQLDDTLLLIEPQTAIEFEQRSQPPIEPTPDDFSYSTAPDTANKVSQKPSEAIEIGTYAMQPELTSAETHRAKSFTGSVEVPAATAKMRMIQIAEEIAAVLAQDPNADIKITVEIGAEFPNGVSDSIKRAVSENARTLGLKYAEWD